MGPLKTSRPWDFHGQHSFPATESIPFRPRHRENDLRFTQIDPGSLHCPVAIGRAEMNLTARAPRFLLPVHSRRARSTVSQSFPPFRHRVPAHRSICFQLAEVCRSSAAFQN